MRYCRKERGKVVILRRIADWCAIRFELFDKKVQIMTCAHAVIWPWTPGQARPVLPLMSIRGVLQSCLVVGFWICATSLTGAQEKDQLAEQEKVWSETVAAATRLIEKDPQVRHYSRRGDACFFLGKFPEAVADYEAMTALDESLTTSHWRLGIAYYFTGQYAQSEKQFSAYHQFDQVDRENGLWRYLAMARQKSVDEAKKNLIKYGKDDRAPLPAIYRMYRQEQTPAELLQSIRDADLNDDERAKQLFYAELYVGLYFDVRDDKPTAQRHLNTAARSSWHAAAGYGPNFMGHVARLRASQLGKADSP